MGDLRIWFSLIAVIAVGSFVPSAEAGGLAVPGEVYPTATVENPAGSLPGGDSGYNNEPTGNEVSQDGRYVVFTSKANSLAPGTNPDSVNVYRKDRQTGAVELASRATGTNGLGGRGNSYEPHISDDGNIVGFISRADIDPADTDGGESDIYIRDIAAGTTKLMTGGIPSDFYQFDLSGDGQYIAFVTAAVLVGTDTNSNPDVFRRKISDGSTALASRIIASETAVNGTSLYPAISNDGRWVAFTSTAPNVIAGFVDANTGSSDIFVRDMNGGAGSNRLISCKFNSAVTGGNAGSQEPDIAGTPGVVGEVKVAYSSYATDTVTLGVDTSTDSSVFLKTLTGISSTLLSISSLGANANSRAHTPSISDDASRVAFSSDATNLTPGAEYYGSYVRNITAGTTTLVSNSTQYAVFGVLSGNGNYVVWDEQGGFTPDSDPDSFGIFGRSFPGGAAEFISRPAGNQPFLKTAASVYSPSSRAHVLSADGRYFVFEGGSHRLYSGSEFGQIYRRDLLTGTTELLSRRTGADGAFSDGSSSSPSVSADGNRVAFISYKPLSDDDTNTYGDIYVRDIANQTTTLVSRADGATGAVSTDGAGTPVISADGNRVVFGSSSSNLGLGAGLSQIYVRDLNTNATLPVSRADGPAGAAGNSNSLEPGISGDGNLVVFASGATNLNPDDLLVDRDIYVRNLAAGTTTLVSRAPGLTGAKLAEYEYGQTISSDGSTVAFETPENVAVPGSTPWPVGPRQVVLRKLATGENTLASDVGGVPSETSVADTTMNRDASVVAFRTDAPNLLPAIGNGDNDYVAVKRMNDGQLSGPPLFGDPLIDTQTGSRSPSLSDNGQCLAFRASGYNDISGNASDYNTSYLQVLSGTCFNPLAVVPALSRLSLKPKKFAVAKKPTAIAAAVAKKKGKKKSPKGTKIRFTLNRDADVSFTIEKRTVGRKVKGKCVKAKKVKRVPKKKRCVRWVPAGRLTRAAQPAGARTLFFSGRIGDKKLKPGRYRVALQATATTGTSPLSKRLPFIVLRT